MKKIRNLLSDSLVSMMRDLEIVLGNVIIRTLLIVSALIRLFFVFVLHPNSASPFAPDEDTYAGLAIFVSEGRAVQDFPGFGPSLYNQSKSLILPASLFVKLGFDSLEAIRIVSVIYGMATPLLVLLCYSAVTQSSLEVKSIRNCLQRAILLVFLASLFFLPSNILWSTLGLRESASQFWMLSQVYFFIKLYLSVNSKRAVFGILLVSSTALSFTSRPQTAIVFTAILVVISFLISLREKSIKISLIAVAAIIFGSTFASTPSVELVREYRLVEQSEYSKLKSNKEKGEKKLNENISALDKCRYDDQKIVFKASAYRCKIQNKYVRENTIPVFTSVIKTSNLAGLEEKRNLNRLNASSALAPSTCLGRDEILSYVACNLSQIPYRLSAFLLRPFIVLDNGSNFVLMAGLENVIWLMLFFFTFYNLFGAWNCAVHRDYLFCIGLFLIVFSTAASLYEGNMGTAFRHKSTILGPLVLLNLLSLHNRHSATKNL